MVNSKQVALIFQTRPEENVGILKGIAAYERLEADWNFFLDDQAMAVRDPEWLFRKNWHGIICRHSNPSVLEEAVRRGIPCVDLDDFDRVIPGVPKVRPDNRAVGHIGAEHLLDRGFKNLAFCGFNSEDWAVARREGFSEAVEAVGLSHALFETQYSHALTPQWDLDGQAQIVEWLGALPQPTPILCCNDLRALQVMSAAHEAEFRVPDDFAVLGANNETVRAEISHPTLSSVPLNTFEWGQIAARFLHALMEGKETEAEFFVAPLQVEVRRSTDALAIEDESVVRALKIIEAEACQQLRVDDLARRLSLSRSLLERRFRKFMRRTPQEEIRNVKIRRTKQLLLETDMTLASIADETGFEHTEYLSVMFKRLVGESPRDFRLRNRVPR